MARLLQQYREKVVPALKTKLKRENVHSLPKLTKIVISMGVGKAREDRKHLDEAMEQLGQLAGQRPQKTRARKSVSAFRLREGMEIGCRVTLRGKRMYEFFDRLITLALPRVRDFRGLNPRSFDGRGNYSLGIKEHIIFPEIDFEKSGESWGMDITVCTTAASDEEARALLTAFNFPFRQ